MPHFDRFFLNNACGPLQVAERRRVRNDRRTEKMRNIRHLLSNFGGMREKRPSSLKILRRGAYLRNSVVEVREVDVANVAALRLKVPLGPQPPAPHTGALTKREEKASRERRGRREATYIYDCLGQHLLGGCKDRDLILDEVIVARKCSTQLDDSIITDKPTKKSSVRVPFSSRALPTGDSG